MNLLKSLLSSHPSILACSQMNSESKSSITVGNVIPFLFIDFSIGEYLALHFLITNVLASADLHL